MEGKKNTKVKIFLFLAFIIVAAVFFVQVSELTRFGINEIKFRNSQLKCEHLDFKINGISYSDQRLLFDLVSEDFDTNITRITVKTDTNQEVYMDLPTIKGGDTELIVFSNVSINNQFQAYPNDCDNLIEDYEII